MPFIYVSVKLGGKSVDPDKFRSAVRKLMDAETPTVIAINVVTNSLSTKTLPADSPPVSSLVITHTDAETGTKQVILLMRFHESDLYAFPKDSKIDVKCMAQLDRLIKKTHVLVEDDGTPHEFSGVFEAVFAPKAMLPKS